jgi:biopolymer transport protein ExbD
MHDYFSYSDTLSRKLALIKFDSITFKTDNLLSKYEIKKTPKKYINFYNINLTFNKNSIFLNDAKINKDEFKKTLLEFIDFSSENKTTLLHLNFSDDLLYQDFLNYLTLINNLKSTKIKVDNNQFVFNKNKVPNCNCN